MSLEDILSLRISIPEETTLVGLLLHVWTEWDLHKSQMSATSEVNFEVIPLQFGATRRWHWETSGIRLVIEDNLDRLQSNADMVYDIKREDDFNKRVWSVSAHTKIAMTEDGRFKVMDRNARNNFFDFDMVRGDHTQYQKDLMMVKLAIP